MPVHSQVETADNSNKNLNTEGDSKFRKLSDFDDPNWEDQLWQYFNGYVETVTFGGTGIVQQEKLL